MNLQDITNDTKEDYELLLQVKYSVLIVGYLLDKTKSHEEICGALKIKKTTLSNIIRKLEPFNILMIQRTNKTIYYSLTFNGLKFFSYILEMRIDK